MSTSSSSSNFFVVGGTLRRDEPSYVKRPLDDELLRRTLNGEYCNILAARQTGKSSLMVRTSERLKEQGIRTVIIDLTSIGSNVSPSEWYFGLLSRLKRELKLTVDENAWWQARSEHSPVQRFSDFLREVILEEINDPIVVFVDEIDSTLKLGFTDDFFAAIRAAYNARSNDPEYKRLTFVLLGVARPADLIKDRTRTPYNIGTSVDVTDFELVELKAFESVLDQSCSGQGKQILRWALEWTGGQPYLTQKLCAEVVEQANGDFTEEKLASLVKQLFLGDKARTETNLRSIRDRVSNNPYAAKMLRIYKRVLVGKQVVAEDQSIEQNELKLTGLVKVSSQGFLLVRNHIYARIFDAAWAKENTPVTAAQRLSWVVSIIAILAIGVAGYFYYRQQTLAADVQAETFVNGFNTSQSEEVRITSLAGLFELGDEYAVQGKGLFNNLTHEEQLALFDLVTPENVGNELLVVVENTYQEQRNTTESNDLLQTMASNLEQTSATGATSLVIEINAWLDGRKQADQGQYEAAITFYTNAWEKSQERNKENAGVLFDRGVANAVLDKFELALKDFDETVRIDNERLIEVDNVIRSNQGLSDQLREGSINYPNLDAPIIIPTIVVSSTPSPTSTPILTATPEGRLFYDDFEGYNVLDGFENEYEKNNIAMNVRHLADGHGNVLFIKPENFGYIIFGEKWQNYAVEFDFMIVGKPNRVNGAFFSLDLRNNPGNGGYGSSNTYNIFWSFYDSVEINYQRESERLAFVNYHLFSDRWYRVKAEAQEDLLRLYIDDELLLQARDSRIISGYTSLSFGGGTGVIFYFDNILVEELK